MQELNSGHTPISRTGKLRVKANESFNFYLKTYRLLSQIGLQVK